MHLLKYVRIRNQSLRLDLYVLDFQRPPLARVLEIALDIAMGLAWLHHRDTIHRSDKICH